MKIRAGVYVAGPVTKRKYEYITVNVSTDLDSWEIIKTTQTKGKDQSLFLVLRKPLSAKGVQTVE